MTDGKRQLYLRKGGPRTGLLFLVVVLLLGVLAACQASGSGPEPAAIEEAVEEAVAQDSAVEESDVEEAVVEEPAEAAEEPAAETVTAAGLQTFAIVSDGSEARFMIDEVLLGEDKTVVGVTADVSGEIQLDPGNPAASQIGVITINARDLTTDADRRNGAIRKFILQSEQDAYQYITFTPTAIEGMPDVVNVGDTFAFQVTGDLAIRDVVRTETFDVEVTAVAENEISGSAKTTVLYKDYGLIIPEVPAVSSVEDDVALELDFMALSR